MQLITIESGNLLYSLESCLCSTYIILREILNKPTQPNSDLKFVLYLRYRHARVRYVNRNLLALVNYPRKTQY
uniref:Uncharacterized protein n=1 Tax=Physcomitrium patens TaxID=3218 RepID=A0A2K1IB55_PHYPA|nr:hypothetical protein PHYPA_031081 [Physcomitrium patens]